MQTHSCSGPQLASTHRHLRSSVLKLAQRHQAFQSRVPATATSLRQFFKLDSKWALYLSSCSPEPASADLTRCCCDRSIAGRDRITPHDVSPELQVPASIQRPHYVADRSTSPENAGVQIHTKKARVSLLSL